MKDCLNSLDHLIAHIRVADVALDKIDAIQNVFQIVPEACHQIINNANCPALGHQPTDDMGAYKTRAPSHEYSRCH